MSDLFEQWLHHTVQAQRDEAMKTSPQLTLGELIAQLEKVPDKSKPVVFDNGYHLTDISSWRGSYCELALEYDNEGTPLDVATWLQKLHAMNGGTVYGYKGGEFPVGLLTPVWVANYGDSHGFLDDTQAVVGVSWNDRDVLIETILLEY